MALEKFYFFHYFIILLLNILGWASLTFWVGLGRQQPNKPALFLSSGLDLAQPSGLEWVQSIIAWSLA
jgi:hypothetical protein